MMTTTRRVLVLIVTLISVVSFARPLDQYEIQIVGGKDAIYRELPFIVSLHDKHDGHFCGGSLIKKNWILTAAHCADDTSIDSVYIGLHEQADTKNVERFSPKKVIVHPKYNLRTMEYDFALIQIAEESTFEPISLNTKKIEIPDSDDEQIMMTVAGWGILDENSYEISNILQKVTVPLVSHEVCNIAYEDVITENMICAGYMGGGKDSCQSDSGGPLVGKDSNGQNILVGVVSWGEGCGRRGFPGVYGDVTSIADWIKQVIP